VFKLICLLLSSRTALVAENLCLRWQLARFQERGVKPRRSTLGIRNVRALVSRFFRWREALVIVKPETFIKRASNCFSRALEMGVPEIRPTAAAKEFADAYLADGVREPDLGRRAHWRTDQRSKLGIRVSPRTVGKYLKRLRGRPNRGNKDQRWASFVSNQANVIACDFFVSVSLTFRFQVRLMAMEIGSRRSCFDDDRSRVSLTIKRVAKSGYHRRASAEGCHSEAANESKMAFATI
jgi:putative transposase